MRGRVVHLPGGGLGTHPYGTNDDQILRSVLRHDLNAALLDAADAAPNVTLRFDAKLAALACGDTDTRAEPRFDTPAGPVSVPADTVVGADGAFSTVRTWMQRGEPADYHQEFLPFVMRPTAASIPVNPSQPALILARGPDTRPTGQDQPGSSCPRAATVPDLCRLLPLSGDHRRHHGSGDAQAVLLWARSCSPCQERCA
jgi:2-polyprenyl-6-methoxyphenol hydroxylase-like FAD-dependent oxidoreductase